MLVECRGWIDTSIRSSPALATLSPWSGGGRRDAARLPLEQLWNEVGADGDALLRCSIAHTMADLRYDLVVEFVGDVRAIDAACAIDDERVVSARMTGTAAGMLPSLHLNLAEVYEQLGELDRAREHLAAGRATLTALPDDGYRAMINAGLDRITEAIKPTDARIAGDRGRSCACRRIDFLTPSNNNDRARQIRSGLEGSQSTPIGIGFAMVFEGRGHAALLVGRPAYFFVGAAFVAGGAFAAFAGSSMTAASAARRFTASMPLTHDSFDSYVSLVATTRPLLASRTNAVENGHTGGRRGAGSASVVNFGSRGHRGTRFGGGRGGIALDAE